MNDNVYIYLQVLSTQSAISFVSHPKLPMAVIVKKMTKINKSSTGRPDKSPAISCGTRVSSLTLDLKPRNWAKQIQIGVTLLTSHFIKCHK